MTVHILKQALELVPDVYEMCKSASIGDGISTTSKENTLASAAKLAYMHKVAGMNVKPEDMIKVATAVKLYGLNQVVSDMTDKMVKGDLMKVASEQEVKNEVAIAEEVFMTKMAGIINIEKRAHIASKLYDAYSDYVSNPHVKRYACADVFVKEAAVRALNGRASVAPNMGFEKIATIVGASDFDKLTLEDKRNISQCVTELDKRAGLTWKGFDFYAESFITKEAACSALMVKIDKNDIPVENILKAPIASILGQDVASEIGSDPYQAKAVIEALPLDSQRLLLSRVR